MPFRLLHVVAFAEDGSIRKEADWLAIAVIPATVAAGMTAMAERERVNQRFRTRKELLLAAQRLSREGRTPSIAVVAEAAPVFRTTDYRCFPTAEPLLAEASPDTEASSGRFA